jgi:hypothetical protein
MTTILSFIQTIFRINRSAGEGFRFAAPTTLEFAAAPAHILAIGAYR